MLQDVFNSSQQIPLEEISSPLSAHLFELCDPELFQEPVVLQTSEVTSSPNNCGGYEDNSSYTTTNLSFPPDILNNNNNHPPQNTDTNTATAAAAVDTTNSNATASSTTATTASNNNNNSTTTNNLSSIFDSPEKDIQNEISGAIDFTHTASFPINPFLTNPQDSFDFSSLQTQAPSDYNDPLGPLMNLQLPCVYDDDCLNLLPPYMRMTTSTAAAAAATSTPPPSCSFLDPTTNTIGTFLPNALITALGGGGGGGGENCGMFGGTMFNMGGCNELQNNQDLDFQADNGGIFCPQPVPRIYNSTELQAMSSNDSTQQTANGGGTSTPLASEMSSLDDSTFKVGKISVEQRKEKINRYMKKRKERNFSKKIKYACRKTLADSRPRVRGRFAKNDEFSEMPRTGCNNHEEDTDDDVVVKEEEDMVDSSDIFAHISGVNSFKCNYSIQSWI